MIQRRLTIMLTTALALLVPAAARAQTPIDQAPPRPMPDYPQAPRQPYQGYPQEPQHGYPPYHGYQGAPPHQGHQGAAPYQGYQGAAPYQGYHGAPPRPYARGQGAAPWAAAQTRFRVVPPYRGTVTVYDGPAVVGRIDQPGVLMVWPGQEYRVVARRGRAVLWTGYVTPARPALDLRWDAQTGEFEPYTLPPVIDPARQEWLLAALEQAWSDADRLALVRGEAARHSFMSSQVDAILARMERDQQRVNALAMLVPRIVDPEQSNRLLRQFDRAGPRRRAAELLGWW